MGIGSFVQEDVLNALRSIGTCVVSNAIETFDVRLRNAGFADARIKCMFPDLPPLVGYAATARLRSGEPPMSGRFYQDRSEWWNSILEIPAPRVVVLEDMDKRPGVGAFLGDMHAAILKALGCVGFVTDGAVRELPRVQGMGFQLFAGNVTVSHAYAHIFDFGFPINVGGLEVRPGDLLHGDRHGILTIPEGLAPQIPGVAVTLQRNEQRIIDFCGSKEFSVDGLRRMINEVG
jgi:4-hydroxy-4-methyl-2-oxoglutarate aldolase